VDRSPRILADSQYAEWLSDRVPLTRFEDVLDARGGLRAGLARRPGSLGGAIRGLLLFRAARDCDVIVLRDNGPGSATLLFCEAWLGRRRRVVLIELLRGRWPRPGWRERLWGLWVAIVRAPALRRAVAVAHVLSPAERDRYAADYGIDRARLRYVPWPWRQTRDPAPALGLGGAGGRPLVLSSGRAYCDWPTLIEAARGAGWQLTIVCGEADAGRVRDLGAGVPIEVRAEIPRAEHAELLARANVYAIVLEDRGVSAGQVRLAHANERGVPVVATRTAALEEYVVDGETALLVPPADPAALRSAIDRVLGDPALAASLRDGAQARSARWVRDDYLDALAALVVDQGRTGTLEGVG